MSDRELLELAAKAAGMPGCVVDYDNRMVFLEDGKPASVEWNPLTDDGDALRLAVKLNMSIDVEVHEGTTYVYAGPTAPRAYASEDWDQNKYAATRRAIVRAAAELGRSQ